MKSSVLELALAAALGLAVAAPASATATATTTSGAAAAGVATATAPSPHLAARTHRRSTRALLTHLRVKAPRYSGYERSKFTLWTEHANGCSTRDEVLIRDARRHPTVEAGCYLAHGRWVSPYDGVATTNPTEEQIDHVVPLAAAWGAGAWRWSSGTRERFANDQGTTYDLLAVSAHSNESKGDKAPDEWLPPRRSFQCRYMADYTAVLWRWHLTVDRPLRTFLQSHLTDCGWPHVKTPKRPAIQFGTGGSGPRHPAVACTKTSSGSCIKAGEFCKQADYGTTGTDADGDKLVCTGNKTHPQWEHP